MTEPTSEQSHILSLVRDTKSNILINAYAGTGKTTTLEMIERATKQAPILYLCFNRRIADEAKTRMLSTTSVKTFNSIGHTIWSRSIGKNLSLDAKKSQKLLADLIRASPKHVQEVMWSCYWEVISGVAMAKALGYIPEGKFPNGLRLITQGAFHARLEETPDDLSSDLIDEILTRSIQEAYQGKIDFNDQIYMPALFGGTFPQFPLTLVDEAQDLSPVNHSLLERLVKDRRVIAVGDPWQNIYGFRGAEQGGMAKLRERYSMVATDLSVSFRCPSKIVEAARWRVPKFTASREGGHVEQLKGLSLDLLGPSPTFLCRNNAPLLGLAFRLLSSGRSVSVAGSDVGPKLIALMGKLGADDMGRSATLDSISEWEAEREDRGSTTAHDLAACMRVFASHGETLAQAILYAQHLFAQKGSVQFMTGHKAKGLEFDEVYFLDPQLCREDEQDLNLKYVITTRSKDKLYFVESRNIQ